MQPGQAEFDAVLAQIVADRHFSAKTVAPVLDRHFSGGVAEGMHQHGHIQLGPAQGVGHGAFVAEIGQGHQHAVDSVAVGPEQVRAFSGFRHRLHRAELGRLGGQRDDFEPFLLQDIQHCFAAGLAEMVREKAAVAHDQAQGCHFCVPFKRRIAARPEVRLCSGSSHARRHCLASATPLLRRPGRRSPNSPCDCFPCAGKSVRAGAGCAQRGPSRSARQAMGQNCL
ncbi:MAG: hypothetical protein BWZ10_02528 [candidate division BRC1 bacterium ADurb.BinA364]|nr:MAG: hypothetical protein BWZ10_02528 [candidate division BRC1 bacterium ADurb.BinA364]